jgi:DNA-binding response OmpR family regulator
MAKKILIVEDDSFLQGLISRKLKADNFDVFIALTADEGLKLIDGGLVPDLILLDLLLPKIDGFEFLKTIRSKGALKLTPVIVFSNLSEEKDIKKAKDLGITDFMVKANFTLDELNLKIKSVLK